MASSCLLSCVVCYVVVCWLCCVLPPTDLVNSLQPATRTERCKPWWTFRENWTSNELGESLSIICWCLSWWCSRDVVCCVGWLLCRVAPPFFRVLDFLTIRLSYETNFVLHLSYKSHFLLFVGVYHDDVLCSRDVGWLLCYIALCRVVPCFRAQNRRYWKVRHGVRRS